MPNNIDKQSKTAILNKIPYKKWWFWCAIALVVVVIVAIVLGVNGNNKSSEPEYYDNEKVDVNGLVVKEACEKVREKG